MFYAVVLDGVSTVYVHADNDDSAIRQGRELSRQTGKGLRLVFVSAHNDPANGPTGMRSVFSAADVPRARECDCGTPAGYHLPDCEIHG